MNCTRENVAGGRKAAARFVPSIFRRARGAILPCVLGSLRNRQQRGERVRGAAPSCALGSSQNRQRRGVGSRFLRFLAHSAHNILGQAGPSSGLGREQFGRHGALVLFDVRDRQLAGLQDHLVQFAEILAPVVERNQSSPSSLRGSLHRLEQINAGRRTMEIVPAADVAQRADKASVSRAVVELAFDPAFAVVEKFDWQVEHIHGFCGTVGVARHDCGS
jgi:hypothetical protein